MVTTKPEVRPEGLYNQAQAACALGVGRHTVKRYEDNGDIKFKVRRAGMRKVTTGAQIIRCWERVYM